ncbi:PAS domain-containing protein [Salinilacihabitans rarus]|uniref:PAS domain-containing protein n=1 Tax=Salinilacihabitans rarus TaxID=2961596 RepID=UPI0020C89B41|nr:PAS domain-containing protein [Salinilacihabitans rarus]
MESRALTESLRETLAVFDGVGEPRTTPEVAARLDLGRRSTYARLERLVERDRLETKKVGANARVWWRPRDRGDATDADWPAAPQSLVDGVLDAVDVAVLVLDGDDRVVRVNAAAERYFGVDRERVVGRDERALVDEHLAPAVEDAAAFTEAVLGTDDADDDRFECRVTPGEGREERWLERRSDPVRTGAYAGGRVERYDDVTDRKRSEHDHRERFESLVEAVEEYAIFTLDADGYVRTWNPGVERIKGYGADEILGEHFSTFYTDADREAGVPERNLRDAAERGSVRDEGWRVRADGSRFWASVTITAIRDEDGTLAGYAKVTRDMTERRERERQLRRERDLTERLLETAPVRLSIFRPDGSIERINSRARRLLGIDESAVPEFGVEDLDLHDADGDPIPPADHPVSRAIETGESVSDRLVRHDGPDGGHRWVSITAAPLFDDDGAIERIVAAGKDVTDLKRTQRQLERQRDELQAELGGVFDRIDDAVHGLDEDLRFTYLNDRAERLLGRSEEELVGSSARETVPDVLGRAFEERYERAMETQEPVVFEEYADAADAWLEVAAYPSESGLSVYARDVTDRVERERALEEFRRRYRTLVEHFPNGAVALVDADLRYVTFGGTVEGDADLTREELEGRAVRDVLPQELADVVVPRYEAALDGETSTFEETVDDEVYRFHFVPVRDDDGAVFAAMATSQEITERTERERELERRREQLAALNSLNRVVREITDAVITQSTREEIEETVCERLAASDSYLFAWIGDVDPATRTVSVRTEAGVEGYLDGITISVDPDDDRSEGPTGRAFRTGEIQTTQDIEVDPRHDPWRDHVERYGFRSSAAIPIVHEDAVYGVLNVYAERPNAFEGREGELIAQIGEIIGHAIGAAERKQALMSDDLVELEFQMQDVFAALDTPVETDGTITLDRAVQVADDEFLVYGTATRDAVDTVRGIVETLPHWEAVDFRARSAGSPVGFELRLTDPPVLSVVAARGGLVERAVIEDGDYRMTIHLAPGADVRRVVDAVESAYPQAEMLRRRQITRPHDDPQRIRRRLLSDLTPRQRTALDAAYHAGFFEWPREASGEEVAESIGVAGTTFHQHLRKAERKVFDALFSAPV